MVDIYTDFNTTNRKTNKELLQNRHISWVILLRALCWIVHHKLKSQLIYTTN